MFLANHIVRRRGLCSPLIAFRTVHEYYEYTLQGHGDSVISHECNAVMHHGNIDVFWKQIEAAQALTEGYY